MKKILFLPMLLIFVLAACGGSEEVVDYPVYEPVDYYESEEPEEISQEMNSTAAIHGLLSYVEHNGNRAYIFGSMHLGRPYFFPLADEVEQALRRADVFAFEFDLTELQDFAGMLEMAGYMMLPLGTTLADVLPEDTFNHLLDVLETFPSVNYEEIAMFQPMVAATMITATEIFPTMGIFQEYSVDTYIMSIARELDRQIIGLNPLAHEMQLLHGAPIDVQIAAIQDLTDRDTMIEAATELGLVEAYFTQDMDALLALLRPYDPEPNAFAEYMIDVIIIQRSIEFAEEIHRLLTETTEPTVFFVTMGIGHMIGNDQGNVFVVLEDMGHTITPLWE
ncbi:MAG: TraB/GumN family protein [Defluviitaleaceae bacterium]|nr:TraB/GumN family protein [Defluviitaleaceae bacterium]